MGLSSTAKQQSAALRAKLAGYSIGLLVMALCSVAQTNAMASEQAIPDGSLIKSAAQPTVYLVKDGQRHAIPDPATLVSRWSWSQVNVEPQVLVDAIPLGQPIPSVVSAGGDPAPIGYTLCAPENSTCHVSGTQNVAFGAKGSFKFKYGVSGAIPCDITTFGDPYYGVVKSCYVGTTQPATSRSVEKSAQGPQPAVQAAQSQPDGAQSQSLADWQQDHQAKIDVLTQEIANHEQQAEQDDADAEQAATQAQQNASANVSGPGGAFLALGNAVQGGMNAGLAESARQNAANERQQAQQERAQLAELGAEQPPVAQNNSETLTLTQMQTQAIRSGNTIEGTVNRAQTNIQAEQQGAAERNAQRDAQDQTDTASTLPSGANAAPSSVTGSESCPNMQQYPDYGVGCNPAREENSCIHVASNVWNSGASELTLVLSNVCSRPVRLSVWGPPDADPPGGETENVGPGQQFTFSSTRQTWHYHADDGVDCTVNNDRPGCNNIGH